MSKILTQTAEFQQIIKRSRFLVFAGYCSDEQTAGEFLEQYRDLSSSHNCWAWRTGQQYRSDDDGEPSGTAGRPILRAIEQQDFDHTVVLVIRWFGGIKLGAGGLSRAYGGCAAECLRMASSEPLIRYSRIEVRCSFEHVNTVHQLSATHAARITEQNWQAEVLILMLEVPDRQVAGLCKALRDASHGQITAAALDMHSLLI